MERASFSRNTFRDRRLADGKGAYEPRNASQLIPYVSAHTIIIHCGIN